MWLPRRPVVAMTGNYSRPPRSRVELTGSTLEATGEPPASLGELGVALVLVDHRMVGRYMVSDAVDGRQRGDRRGHLGGRLHPSVEHEPAAAAPGVEPVRHARVAMRQDAPE